MFRTTPLTGALWLALASCAHAAPASAPVSSSNADADASAASAVRDFDRLQVTATRTQRAIVDVPGSVDVIDREQMDRALVHDLKDLLRYTPGVSATGNSGRFSGISGIRIRGLDGNRVLIQTDGIPVSDNFSFGSYLNANRNFVDMDTLKRVEIVRGPASALYGSDALGGVVAYVTKDPADYLAPGKDSYVGLKFGYESEWKGLFAGALVAFGGDRWSGMAAVSHRQGQESETQGDNRSIGAARTAPNPLNSDGRSLLSKLVYAPSANQRWKLTVEGNEDYSRIDALSNVTASILSQRGRDHQTRARVSLGHEVDQLATWLADDLQWQLYRQDSQSLQRTDERRSNATLRHMEHDFDQRLYGLQANLHKRVDQGRVVHDISYGIDLSHTDTHEKRDGHTLNLRTGAISKTVGMETFPVRDFPITETIKAGAYLQDEIALADGRFSLTPALRADYYRLSPQVDAIFATDNPGVTAKKISDRNVSPKLGVIWRLDDAWSLYANYAHGFRAPPYNDVNIGFTNLLIGYTAIANPDLKPETSRGAELGVRYAGTAIYAGLSAYRNAYRDFIESYRFVGFNADGLMLYQSRNVDRVTIRGVEAKAGIDFGALDARWAGWSLQASAAYARGDNRTDGTPLNSVDPLRGVLGLGYDRSTWGTQLVATAVAKKRRPELATYYTPAGYATLDLLAHWHFTEGARLDVGVFNLADRRYIDWNMLPGATLASSAVLDRYTGAGRNVSVSLALDW
ncbi:hemoglobin/transferrin/lactoferrin receptor protein [Xanthomonas sacchari]|uniref:TonB-dependent hemoglobin/transferrin/lactoferrin family receptor n=1 Tax=unclassified Xanthomonas TaxID=2643310 RepID=UPI00137040C3|nr:MULTISPECIES: TonB-dependent hemoglobin/transferrin/lactoferrin family receptor [unclassified Xanthomonas]MBB6364992.1 hemoglobin/transferrin/lactoferrin receptor protein [Xanthomonas sp. F10]MXV34420.1 TonB-dependent hemoglobin/transferrin/lactoferrin family receptor [Xanthomonas sp. LMG 8989]